LLVPCLVIAFTLAMIEASAFFAGHVYTSRLSDPRWCFRWMRNPRLCRYRHNLGFTHICAKTRDGRFFLKRITISKRMRAKLKEIKVLLKHRRHEPIPVQGMWLASVVRGHCAYYAVPGNISAVMAFRLQVVRHWFKALRRRSQRTRLNWARMDRLEKRWLPPAKILHPYPEVRFAANTRGGSRVR